MNTRDYVSKRDRIILALNEMMFAADIRYDRGFVGRFVEAVADAILSEEGETK